MPSIYPKESGKVERWPKTWIQTFTTALFTIAKHGNAPMFINGILLIHKTKRATNSYYSMEKSRIYDVSTSSQAKKYRHQDHDCTLVYCSTRQIHTDRKQMGLPGWRNKDLTFSPLPLSLNLNSVSHPVVFTPHPHILLQVRRPCGAT